VPPPDPPRLPAGSHSRAQRARALLGRHRKKTIALIALVIVPALAHAGVALSTQIHPPPIADVPGEPTIAATDPDLRALGAGYARHRGKILEVRLAGSPEEIGHQHGRLLYREMVANEGDLLAQFSHYVPVPPLRWLIMDISRVQFREVDQGMTAERRREVAAEARAFQPDPYDGLLPTYHRFIFLQSLYDIALSFEHSPLLGCTSFALTGDAAQDGHVLLARNFDFEAGPVFDEGKAVFLVREEGRIPYASVAWPGLVGAVSGMNAEGLAVVVHGGRAREAQTEGEPVVHTTRDLLGRARTTAEALALLEAKRPMVSHLLMLADATGDVAIAERAPGARLFVRRGAGKAQGAGAKVPLTNHFEGPLGDDPANRRIEAVTSTRPRRLRLDELLENLPKGATVQDAVGVLRDRRSLGGAPLKLGNRRSIDALIATHGVVMDATDRVIWVSEGPHLAGRFLRFDVGRLLAAGYDPAADPAGAEPAAIAADPILTNGQYEAWVTAGSRHEGEN
jgi:isopenicillin-N N-acyltransferase like protein